MAKGAAVSAEALRARRRVGEEGTSELVAAPWIADSSDEEEAWEAHEGQEATAQDDLGLTDANTGMAPTGESVLNSISASTSTPAGHKLFACEAPATTAAAADAAAAATVVGNVATAVDTAATAVDTAAAAAAAGGGAAAAAGAAGAGAVAAAAAAAEAAAAAAAAAASDAVAWTQLSNRIFNDTTSKIPHVVSCGIIMVVSRAGGILLVVSSS